MQRLSDIVFEFIQSRCKVFYYQVGGNAFIDALSKNNIEFVPVHQTICRIAAEYYSRLSNKIGVALVTTGPRVCNNTFRWGLDKSIPILVISGQVKLLT